MREPDNELYDRGCDLVEAATSIRRAAASPEAIRAVPAVLGCIESALDELLQAAAALEATTTHDIVARSRRTPDPRTAQRIERMHAGYVNLRQSLSDAIRASSAARSLVRRVL